MLLLFGLKSVKLNIELSVSIYRMYVSKNPSLSFEVHAVLCMCVYVLCMAHSAFIGT